VSVNGKALHSGGSHEKVHDLPKFQNLYCLWRKNWRQWQREIQRCADPRLQICDPLNMIFYRIQPQYPKLQTLCPSDYRDLACRSANCRYDHNLVDSKRIEQLACPQWAYSGMDMVDYLSVECRVRDGRATWKITLKPAAFAKLQPGGQSARIVPPRPFSYEDEDLLNVIRHMEGVV